MNKIRIGVVGLGFGRHHVRTLANIEDADLVAVADQYPDVPGGLEGYAATYGARAYRDGVAMIEEENLDAVSLCVSPRYRAPLIEAAAHKGVALFIEKPWATNLAHARELARLCEETNTTVMVAFSFRYHPAIVKLQELMDSKLGAGWMLNGQYVFSWAPPAESWLWDPENGNGFFNENSCHLFDAVCYLLGDPVSVMAEAINPLGTPSEHAAALSIRFANGAIAALTIGGIAAGAYHAYPRIEIVTENGQARLTGRDHIWETVSWATRDADTVSEIVASPEALGSTRYTHAFHHFFGCIRTGQSPTCGVADGVRSVALAMAVYESARTGNKVTVDL